MRDLRATIPPCSALTRPSPRVRRALPGSSGTRRRRLTALPASATASGGPSPRLTRHTCGVGPHPNVLVANDAHDPAAPHAESIFAVTLPDFTLKSDECVIAFRCSVRGARIVRLSSVPDDWTVAIDNENTSTLKAHIVDGVAALRPGQTEGQTNYFRNFLVIEKEASGEFALPFYVKVDVTVATNAELTALRHVRFVGDQIILRAAE